MPTRHFGTLREIPNGQAGCKMKSKLSMTIQRRTRTNLLEWHWNEQESFKVV